MKFRLEHKLPKKLRYARVYFEAGSAKVFFSLDGANADWHARIGSKRQELEMTDSEYARFRATVPAVETLNDDGRMVIVRNSEGYEEEWQKPQWVLTRFSKRKSPRD